MKYCAPSGLIPEFIYCSLVEYESLESILSQILVSCDSIVPLLPLYEEWTFSVLFFFLASSTPYGVASEQFAACIGLVF